MDERFFNLSHDMLLVSAVDGSCRQVNPTWTRVLGWSVAEIETRPIGTLIHPDDLPDVEMRLDRLQETGGAAHMVTRLLARDGGHRTIEWHAVADGDRILGAGRDITEDIRIREELSQLVGEQMTVRDRERSRIAEVIHDGPLQNCVAALMSLEVAGQVHDSQGREDAEQAAEQCRRAIQQLKDMISGLDTMPPVTSDLSQAIRETCAALQKQFGVTVDVSIQLEGNLGADRFEAVLRIVREGVTNVGKHAPSKRARLRVEADSARVSVTLQDDGAGDIASTPILLAAPASNSLGAGYGLRALRGSLRAIGGTLDLDSEASGSTLSAVIPLSA